MAHAAVIDLFGQCDRRSRQQLTVSSKDIETIDMPVYDASVNCCSVLRRRCRRCVKPCFYALAKLYDGQDTSTAPP